MCSAELPLRPRQVAPTPDTACRLAAAALHIAEALEPSTVLERTAEQVAALCGGVCQARFAPAQRPGAAIRAVSGPERGAALPAAGGAGEPYGALLARLSDRGLERAAPPPADPEPGAADVAALLTTPLIARGRRLGALDLVLPDAADVPAAQRLLLAIAAHAALALDTADQLTQLRPHPGQGRAGDQAQLLALIAHDLRGPLATLSSSVQLLVRVLEGSEAPDRDRIARLAELADSAVAQLEAQINAMAPPRRGRAGEAFADVDLVALAQLLVSFYQQTTGRHRLVLEAAAPALPGPWSRPHLERVIGNLLANAIKYSPAGGTIRVEVGRAEDELGAWATLAVHDQGIGIPRLDLPRVSLRGFRAGNVGQLPGTGFGLASVREVVEQYGGSLAVASAASGGTSVLVRLPLPQAPEPPRP